MKLLQHLSSKSILNLVLADLQKTPLISTFFVPILLALIFSCWLIPLREQHYAKEMAYYQEKEKLAQRILIDFTQYRLNRNRLIFAGIEEAKSNERGWKLDKEFYTYKMSYREERDKYHDLLYQDLTLSQYYFSPKIVQMGEDFMMWDSNFSGKRPNQLPNDEVYFQKQKPIIAAIKAELSEE